ncbi:HypC/HybG/HupF family hydrogenase formation chaperone [Facilibium subflavum]|uniref:HypC/HybG/HupF family hydrogenase formation chaperone n=1 Tax=Facilibium subflavum TaxID=2219058 RepID=UPI000E64C688|nr:HypC/HybG/HupF family hydrogenase formation chaperone [Facilibium subflavum]
MCLAIPAQVISLLADQRALVDIGGVQKEISLQLLAEPLDVGEFVIVHVGFALSKLDEFQAKKTLDDFKIMLEEAK